MRPGIIFSINSEKEQDVYGSGPEYTSEESMFLGGSIDAFYYIPLNSGLYFYTGPGVSYTFRNREYYDNTIDFDYYLITPRIGLTIYFN